MTHQEFAKTRAVVATIRKSPTLLLDHTFKDFDELTETVKAWDLDFRQLDGGSFQGSITQFVGEGFQFARARFGLGLEQSGSPPPGLRTFVVPADSSQRLFWRGNYVSGLNIMAFPPGGELAAISNPGFDVFTFSVTDEMLAGTCALKDLPDLPGLLGGREVFRCSPEMMRSLRSLFIQTHGRIVKSKTAGEAERLLLESDLAGALLSALNDSEASFAPPSPARRSRALKRSLEHIKSHPAEPISVRDLAGISGASWRTLDYAFRERFGVTPKEYLRGTRLNEVRRELRRADPDSTKITDVANHWGFWHMGQFAADYRRLFGELPSATLKRARGKN